MILGAAYPACPQLHAEPGAPLQIPSPESGPHSSSVDRNPPPAYTACPPTERKPRGAAFPRPSTHSVPHFLPRLHTPCTKTQNPLLYFQQLTHSSAIKGEGEGASWRYHSDLKVAIPRRCHPDRREGSAFFFVSLPHDFPLPISIRINTSRQIPRFALFWPKSSARNPFRIRTSRKSVCKVFRIRTCKKQGEGEGEGNICNQLPSFLVAPAGTAPFPSRSTAAWYSFARN